MLSRRNREAFIGMPLLCVKLPTEYPFAPPTPLSIDIPFPEAPAAIKPNVKFEAPPREN